MSQSESDSVESASATARRKFVLFLPFIVFALLAALFLIRLYAGDASRIPSALIGKQAPTFALPALEGLNGVPGLASDDLRQGHVSVVNVFASWCAPCHIEHDALMALASEAAVLQNGVRIAGVAYKDEPANAKKFLEDGGNPYALVGVDASGRVAIDFGVYGVPETFVVRGDGTIAYKFIGPLTRQSLQTTLLPEIEKALR